MFRRTKSEIPTETVSTKTDGKGRPTPSRRDAEAAAKARAKDTLAGKGAARSQREARVESSRSVRAAMKAGDERYFPARDKGPVRRFIRDFVDARFSFIELVVPLLVVTMILGSSGRPDLAQIGNTIMLGTIVLVAADMFVLRWRLRREMGRRFPDEPLKGTTYYAITRAMQMKFMRMPKAKVRIGQELPEHYR